LIKMLDNNLKYAGHYIVGDEIHINVESRRKVLKCPYCGEKSKKVHSVYGRTIQDLPISGKKVSVEIKNRKMFCLNKRCGKKTFAERYAFVGSKGKKSKRLEAEMMNIAKTSSSLEAAKTLSKSTVRVSASTIRNLLKKMEPRQSDEKE